MQEKLSIAAKLYQSEPCIDEFYARASAAARELVGEEFETTLVNDGSPGNSLDVAIKLTEHVSHVTLGDLSGRFEQPKAMPARLTHAKGDKYSLLIVIYEKPQEGC